MKSLAEYYTEVFFRLMDHSKTIWSFFLIGNVGALGWMIHTRIAGVAFEALERAIIFFVMLGFNAFVTLSLRDDFKRMKASMDIVRLELSDTNHHGLRDVVLRPIRMATIRALYAAVALLMIGYIVI